MNSLTDNVPLRNPWTDKVRVVAITTTHQAGEVKAFASIRIGEALEIRDLKVIQQPGQKAWVALPDRQRNDRHGYAPIVETLDGRLKQAIDYTVLQALQHHLTGGVQ